MEPEEPPPLKKVKKPLTEEEKKAKAEMEALQAEEKRKKKIRDWRTAIKKHMFEEEKLSKSSMLEIHKEWRKMMRLASLKELRADIQWLSQEHVREVSRKDRNIEWWRHALAEAEEQHRLAFSKHLSSMYGLLDLHFIRMKAMENTFQERLKDLNDSFTNEREQLDRSHEAQKTEMGDMMATLKADFEEALDEKRQEYEFNREELKNNSLEEYNVLRIQLEGKIEEQERQMEITHSKYIASTEKTVESFQELSAKDAVASKVIQQRMRALVHLHESLASTRALWIVKSKEWEDRNKTLRDEKDRLNNYYLTLKHDLGKTQKLEHAQLKVISKDVGDAKRILQKYLDKLQILQKLGALCRRLETEHEQIFPFNPLYTASVPTAPLANLDLEMSTMAEKEKCKIHGIHADGLSEDIVGGEPKVGHVEPKSPKFRPSIQMHIPIDATRKASAEPLAPHETFRWATYAVDDDGNEVSELDYMQNFQKRYNKVILDKLAIDIEKSKLMDENVKLQTTLGYYLDGVTLSEKAKAKYNALMDVGPCKLGPKPTTPIVQFLLQTRKSRHKNNLADYFKPKLF